jgi:hypothetical protein
LDQSFVRTADLFAINCEGNWVRLITAEPEFDALGDVHDFYYTDIFILYFIFNTHSFLKIIN